ncbi:MAG: hypothetical protein QMB03_13750 [Spirosomataceae bacterium]|jgi:hypothetical protein
MKNFVILSVLVSLFFSCESQNIDGEIGGVAMIQAEEIANFTCINKQADNAIPVSEAKDKIAGEWQLKAMLTMIQVNEVPNVVLKINKDLSVTVLQAGKKIHDDKLIITEKSGDNYRLLKIESSRQEFSNGDFNFLYGNLRVCDNELFIDNGIAFDAPGYYFRKK